VDRPGSLFCAARISWRQVMGLVASALVLIRREQMGLARRRTHRDRHRAGSKRQDGKHGKNSLHVWIPLGTRCPEGTMAPEPRQQGDMVHTWWNILFQKLEAARGDRQVSSDIRN
jgi:hypothetical protein